MAIPATINGLSARVCISALQKHIRRGDEEGAMKVACELMTTSKAFHTWMWNRLAVISHEDIGLADPFAAVYIETTAKQAQALYAKGKWRTARMFVGNAIRYLARANKSREGDHFHWAMGWPIEQGQPPEIPDYAYDKHTPEGRRMGRGTDHFREEGTKLVPPAEKDERYQRYEEGFYQAMAEKEAPAEDEPAGSWEEEVNRKLEF